MQDDVSAFSVLLTAAKLAELRCSFYLGTDEQDELSKKLVSSKLHSHVLTVIHSITIHTHTLNCRDLMYDAKDKGLEEPYRAPDDMQVQTLPDCTIMS